MKNLSLFKHGIFVKKMAIYLCACFLLLLFFDGVFRDEFFLTNVSGEYIGYFSRTSILGVATLLSIILLFPFWNFLNKEIATENFFLVIVLPLSFLFMLLIPPFSAPDEINHFIRGLSIVEGYPIIPHDCSVSMKRGLEEAFGMQYGLSDLLSGNINLFFEKECSEYSITTLAIYSPITYLSLIPGLLFSYVIKDVLFVLYLTRLSNIVISTALVYYAIKKIPCGKEIVLIVSCLPFAIQGRSTVSLDGFSYAVIVAFFAEVIYIYYAQKKICTKDYIIILSLMFLLAFAKIVYCVIALILIIIPCKCFESKAKEWTFKSLSLFGVIVLNLIWTFVAGQYLVYSRGGSNTIEKLLFFIAHPFNYVRLVNHTLWFKGNEWFNQIFGNGLVSLDVKTNTLIVVSLFCVLIYIVANTSIPQMKWNESFLLIGCSLLCTILIFSSLLVQWTQGEPADITCIEGIQGRYFIPLIPTTLLGVKGILKSSNKMTFLKLKFACCTVYVANIMCLAYIFNAKW